MSTSDGPALLSLSEQRKEEAGQLKFWSPEFFELASRSLNSNPVFSPIFKGIRTTILAESTDSGGSYLIRIADGVISVRPAVQGERADFRFSAPYSEWVAVVRDGVELRGDVVKGKVKFRGSMPMMLLMLGKVSRAEKEIVSQMRSMRPEY